MEFIMRKRLPRLADDVLPKLLVPTRRLENSDRPALLAFYRKTSLTDRAAHFGHPLSDDKLSAYVYGLDFVNHGHFAAMGAASVIVGVAHCTVFDGQGVVSAHVAHGYRWRGIGERLGELIVRFARSRELGWLRAYFRKEDAIAASLARRWGMHLNVGLDRFYAELRLSAPARGEAATTRRPLGGIQLLDVHQSEPAATAGATRSDRVRGGSASGKLSEGLGRTACHPVGRQPSHQVA